MASIFLSYARADGTKAGRIANGFEAAGHSVWWDRHIGTGSNFSAEIDEALRNADFVVVLWSAQSIQSSWVLDEAAVGRDSGRLLPVLIEDVLPPLGFRQFQALPLTGTLRRNRALQPLLDAVAAGVKPSVPHAYGAHKARFPLANWTLMTALFLALAGIAYFLFGRGDLNDSSVTAAIEPAVGGDRAKPRELAQNIAIDLGPSRGDPLPVQPAATAATTAAAPASTIAPATTAATAQQTGTLRTAESGGTAAGCVSWELFAVPSPVPIRVPQRIRIHFQFRNACGRTIFIKFQTQTADYGGRLSMGARAYKLEPGEVYGNASAGPFAYFNPPTDRYLNFWLFQFDQPPGNADRVDMSRCNPRYDQRKPAPACPPAFRLM